MRARGVAELGGVPRPVVDVGEVQQPASVDGEVGGRVVDHGDRDGGGPRRLRGERVDAGAFGVGEIVADEQDGGQPGIPGDAS